MEKKSVYEKDRYFFSACVEGILKLFTFSACTESFEYFLETSKAVGALDIFGKLS